VVASALLGGLVVMGGVVQDDFSAHAGPVVSGPVVSGPARVLDGDTLDIGGTRIRLEGIDAPETGQTCAATKGGFKSLIGAKTWDCGTASANHLDKLVAGKRVVCESRGKDKYGRVLGICAVDGHDINAAMVRAGLAWAFVKYSQSYVGAEAEARAARTGIWQADSEPAWVFREKRWASAETEAPQGCAIKGNVTRKGLIYHMPWSPWYGRVKIDEAKGERWFCSESDAIAAGWRSAAAY